MADLSKILQQESEGIMFPFRTGVQSTTTEQQVYDSATDGIMTVTGQQYSLPEYKGPTATVQYGTEEEGYPRMLREIERGELPQFRQEDFPKVGEGVMQPSTPVTQPVEPTPTEPEAPAIDPCPPGFKYDPVQKVCVPIEQPKSDRDEPPVIEPRTNNQIASSGLQQFGIKLTGGKDSIFADPEKTRAMFGTKQTIDVRDTPKLASYDDVAARGGLSEEYRQALGPELYDAYEDYNKLKNKEGQIPVDKADEANALTAKINELEAARQQEQERLKQERLTPTSTGERFGELPTFTQDDFDLGLPNLGPLTILANFLGKTFIGPFQLNNLTKLGVIEKTGKTINNKDQYTLTENGVRAIVQAEVDKDKSRAERAVKPLMEKTGVTQRELEKGEGSKVDAFVKEYQERESKKYTDKQKSDFMTKVNKNRFKDIGGLKQIKSDKFTGEGFTRGR